MNILLLHAYSVENKGDAAILSGMLSGLKSAFPGADFRISALDTRHHKKDFEGVPWEPGLFYQIIYAPKSAPGKLIRLAKAFFGIYPKESQSFFDALSWADIIIGVGGGYINARPSFKSTISLWLTLLEFKLAKKTGKPVVLFSQSVGPFAYRFQKYLARRVLKDIDLILTRESLSFGLLKNMGLKDSQIRMSPDAGFAFVSDKKQAMKGHLERLGINFSRPVVAITVRNWLPGRAQGGYEYSLAKFADWLISQKAMQVIFVPQVTSGLHNDDDREVQHRIINRMEERNSLWSLNKNYDHYGIKGIYENMDFVVGTRMHSVIFSLTGFIPSLAIAYEYKTPGIMADLKLSEWVIQIEEVNFKVLSQKFNALVANKPGYLKTLSETLPPYIRNSGITTKLIFDFIK